MRKLRDSICTGTALCVMGLAATAAAQAPTTQAYWRFEEIDGVAATPGDTLTSTIPGGEVVTFLLDSSGNANPMRTFHSPNVPDDPDYLLRLETSPEFVSNVPAPTVSATGAANLLAGDFDSEPALESPAPFGTPPNRRGADDIYSLDAFNVGGPVNSHVFNAFTIEASFRIDTLNRFQIIVGKDDNFEAAPGPLGPFALKVLDNNVLEAYSFDATGMFRNVLSDQSNPGAAALKMVAGRWYNAAITNDGASMRMYLDDTTDGVGNYVLMATNNDIAGGGGMIGSDDIWTIGRGWFNDGPGGGPDGVADFFDGQIDEVRLTDGVLAPSQFLFASAAPALDADFNNSGLVDGQDFVIWQRNVGKPGGNALGDADGNGLINGADLTAWKSRYGMPMASGATAPVPEPGAAALAFGMMAAGVARGRQRVVGMARG
jgi:hypothetical protein